MCGEIYKLKLSQHILLNFIQRHRTLKVNKAKTLKNSIG